METTGSALVAALEELWLLLQGLQRQGAEELLKKRDT